MTKLTLPQNLYSALTVLEGFEDSADWTYVQQAGGSVATNVAQKTQGTASLKMTAGAAGINHYAERSSLNLSMVGATHFRGDYYIHGADNRELAYYLSANAGLSKLWSGLFVPGLGGAKQKFIAGGRWYTFQSSIPSASGVVFVAGGGITLADPIVKIRMRTDFATEAFSYDNFCMVTPQPALIISFDDAYTGVYNLAFPYMRARNIPGVVYIITDNIGTGSYLTATMLAELDADGWDVANHTKDHANFTTLTQAQIETELSAAKGVLDGLGLTGASDHVAYPYGQYDADTIAAMIAQSMKSGRMADSYGNRNYQVLPFANADDKYYCAGVEIGSANTLANAKNVVDECVTHGIFTNMVFHNIVASGATGSNWNYTDFCALMDYICTKNIPVITMTQLETLKSGTLEVDMPALPVTGGRTKRRRVGLLI